MKRRFSYPFWMILYYLLCFIIGWGISDKNPNDVGFGGLIYIVLLLAVFVVIVIPIHCILYSRRVLMGEKRKWLFVPYNALCVALLHIPFFIAAGGSIPVYTPVLFLWAALWTAIPLLFPAKKKDSPPIVT